MGAFGDLWGPIGNYPDMWGPMGTYGVWGINFCTPILTPTTPLLSSKHQIYIGHITHVVYTAKSTCYMRHHTEDFIHKPAMALLGLLSM